MVCGCYSGVCTLTYYIFGLYALHSELLGDLGGSFAYLQIEIPIHPLLLCYSLMRSPNAVEL
jgi:hypothetical protein